MPHIEIYRVRIDPAHVERLMEIRAAAVAEFQEQVPGLLRAELVRVDEEVWLDVLLWDQTVDPERLAAAAACTPLSAEMHGLIAEELGHDHGELAHGTAGTHGTERAWASVR